MDNSSSPQTINQPTLETNIFNEPIPTPSSTPTTPTTATAKKSHKGTIVIVIIVAIIFIASIIALIFLLPKLFGQNEQIDDNISVAEPAKETLDVYDNLAIDYKSGGIDIAEYFKQLVYLEIDSSKADKGYQTEYDHPGISHRDEILRIIEENYGKLDKDLVEQYVLTLTQKSFVYGTESETTSNANDVILADSEEEQRSYKMHYFDRARLSKNKHFIIWYTEEGEDKATQSQIDTIDDTLESTISAYSDTFGEKYRFDPEITTASPLLANSANKILRANGIPENTWKNTMNVYVYDTKSESVLGYWLVGKANTDNIILRFIVDAAMKEDYLTRPYVVLNKRLLNNTVDFKQVVSHELFHHYQYSYCMTKTNDACPDSQDFSYSEMAANYASATIHGYSEDSFLSNWSNKHREGIHSGLINITSGGATGYGSFPYLAAYTKYGSNQTVMAANSHSNPLAYLEEKAGASNMQKIAAASAYYTISNSYDSVNASSDESVQPVINEFELEGETAISLEPGAISFYKLDQNATVKLNSTKAVYVLIGQKGNSYQKINEYYGSSQSVQTEECAKNHDTCYLAVANPSLTSATTVEADYDNLDNNGKIFRTRYLNYKTKIVLNLSMNGIDASTTAEGVVDELHQRQHLNQKVNAGIGGVSMDCELYTDFYHGVSYTSRPKLGFEGITGLDIPSNMMPEWTKSEDVSAQTNLGILAQKLEKGDNVEKIDDAHYKLKISAADLKSYMSMNGDSTSKISLPKDGIPAEISVENGYITNVKYDFSGIAGIDKFTANVSFSDYNKNESVYIPLSVVRNAKTE